MLLNNKLQVRITTEINFNYQSCLHLYCVKDRDADVVLSRCLGSDGRMAEWKGRQMDGCAGGRMNQSMTGSMCAYMDGLTTGLMPQRLCNHVLLSHSLGLREVFQV